MTDLRPPPEHAHLRWHWLRRDDELRPWEWVNSYWSDGHEGARIWPEMPVDWRYHKPCDHSAVVPDPNDERQVEVMARAHWDTKFHRYKTATWEQLLRLPKGSIGHRVVVQERQKMRAALRALAEDGR